MTALDILRIILTGLGALVIWFGAVLLCLWASHHYSVRHKDDA